MAADEPVAPDRPEPASVVAARQLAQEARDRVHARIAERRGRRR